MPYERGVNGEQSAGIWSLKYTAAGSTGLPNGSGNWQGSQGSSVSSD